MRITVEQADKVVTLKIEGRVVEPVVSELHRAWAELSASLGSRKLSVDLRGVTFLDTAARDLLTEIYAETGAEFLADTPMTKYFAEEAILSARRNFRQLEGGFR